MQKILLKRQIRDSKRLNIFLYFVHLRDTNDNVAIHRKKTPHSFVTRGHHLERLRKLDFDDRHSP